MKSVSRLIGLGIILTCIFSNTLHAQSYDLTLIHNGDYGFTVSTVSKFDSGSYEPITQSYGFTLVLPDGITITIDDTQPSNTNITVTPIDGTLIDHIDPTMTNKDLFLITTDTQGETISSHANGAQIPLVTLTVNGAPATGNIRLLNNNSILASDASINGSLDAFFQVDIINDGNIIFENEFDTLTDTEFFSFETLSTPDLTDRPLSITLHPNPANDIFYIKGLIHKTKLQIYDVNGKLVREINDYIDSPINIQNLESAIYLIRIDNGTFIQTKQLIKF